MIRSLLPHHNVAKVWQAMRFEFEPAVAARYRGESDFITLRYVIALLPRPLSITVYHPIGEESLETAENHVGWETIPLDGQTFDVCTYTHNAMSHITVPYH
jgi:hypothetical protein